MHHSEVYLYSQVTYWKELVDKVRKLHQPVNDKWVEGVQHCSQDNHTYPCPTIKALDGEQ